MFSKIYSEKILKSYLNDINPLQPVKTRGKSVVRNQSRVGVFPLRSNVVSRISSI